jgi:hypothetical protein
MFKFTESSSRTVTGTNLSIMIHDHDCQWYSKLDHLYHDCVTVSVLPVFKFRVCDASVRWQVIIKFSGTARSQYSSCLVCQ